MHISTDGVFSGAANQGLGMGHPADGTLNVVAGNGTNAQVVSYTATHVETHLFLGCSSFVASGCTRVVITSLTVTGEGTDPY